MREILGFNTWFYAKAYADHIPGAYVVPHPYPYSGWAVAVAGVYVREGDYDVR